LRTDDSKAVYGEPSAVKQNVDALQFASDEMKADKEFVLAAVNENGMALRFASNIFGTSHFCPCVCVSGTLKTA